MSVLSERSAFAATGDEGVTNREVREPVKPDAPPNIIKLSTPRRMQLNHSKLSLSATSDIHSVVGPIIVSTLLPVNRRQSKLSVAISGTPTPAVAHRDYKAAGTSNVVEAAENLNPQPSNGSLTLSEIENTAAEIENDLRAALMKRNQPRKSRLTSPNLTIVEESDTESPTVDNGAQVDTGLFVETSGQPASRLGTPATSSKTPQSRMLRAIPSATGRRLRFDRASYAQAASTFAESVPKPGLWDTGNRFAEAVLKSWESVERAQHEDAAEAVNTSNSKRLEGSTSSFKFAADDGSAIYHVDKLPPLQSYELDLAVGSLEDHRDPLPPPQYLVSQKFRRPPQTPSSWVSSPGRPQLTHSPRGFNSDKLGPGCYNVRYAAVHANDGVAFSFSAVGRDSNAVDRVEQLIQKELRLMALEGRAQGKPAASDGAEEVEEHAMLQKRFIAPDLTARRLDKIRNRIQERNTRYSKKVSTQKMHRKTMEVVHRKQAQQAIQQHDEWLQRKQTKLWLKAIPVVQAFIAMQVAVKERQADNYDATVLQSLLPVKKKCFDAWKAFVRSRKMVWAVVVFRIRLCRAVHAYLVRRRKAKAGVVLQFLKGVDDMVSFGRSLRTYMGRIKRVRTFCYDACKIIAAQCELIVRQWDVVEVQLRVQALKSRLLQNHRRGSVAHILEKLESHLGMGSEGHTEAPVAAPTKKSVSFATQPVRNKLEWPRIRSLVEREGEGAKGLGGKSSVKSLHTSSTASLEHDEARWNVILAEVLRNASLKRVQESQANNSVDDTTASMEANAATTLAKADKPRTTIDSARLSSRRMSSSSDKTKFVAPHRRASVTMSIGIGVDAATAAMLDVGVLVQATTTGSYGQTISGTVVKVPTAADLKQTEYGKKLLKMDAEMQELQLQVLEELPAFSYEYKRKQALHMLRKGRLAHLAAVRAHYQKLRAWEASFEFEVFKAREKLRSVQGQLYEGDDRIVREAVERSRPRHPMFIGLQPYEDIEALIRTLYAQHQEQLRAAAKDATAPSAATENAASQPRSSMHRARRLSGVSLVLPTAPATATASVESIARLPPHDKDSKAPPIVAVPIDTPTSLDRTSHAIKPSSTKPAAPPPRHVARINTSAAVSSAAADAAQVVPTPPPGKPTPNRKLAVVTMSLPS